MSAWYLFFSPDFVGYDNPKLADHILEGNAYVYKFDVSDIVNKGAPNEVVLENIGDEVAAQYTDPKDIEFYKAASIIANPIKLEGKGIDVVQITKEAAPTRIIVGKKSTITLTIKNNLPGAITDVEVADADLPSGLSGKTVTGKLDKPVPAGGSYSVTYDVTADKVGYIHPRSSNHYVCGPDRELPETDFRHRDRDSNLISKFPFFNYSSCRDDCLPVPVLLFAGKQTARHS